MEYKAPQFSYITLPHLRLSFYPENWYLDSVTGTWLRGKFGIAVSADAFSMKPDLRLADSQSDDDRDRQFFDQTSDIYSPSCDL